MGTEVTVSINPQLPAAVRAALEKTGRAAFDEFSQGVTSAFGIISYRGKTWRIRKGGEEQAYVDGNGDSIQSIEVILVRSNPQPSKIHYDKKYQEGDDSPPRCWSANGITPDMSVEEPIHPNCASCPKNVWGSRVTEEGKKSRACSDVRRMAVVFKSDLEDLVAQQIDEVEAMLLRVPPASLNPLKDYVEKVLLPKGIPPYCVVTRIGFDTAAAYPKLTFKGARFLSEAEAMEVLKLRDSEGVRRILAESIENEAAGTTPPASGAQQGGGPITQPFADTLTATGGAPAASPAAGARKLRPAEEEELHAAAGQVSDDNAFAPAPAEPQEEADSEEIAPPPAETKPAKPRGRAAAKAKNQQQAAPATAPADTGDDSEDNLDDMLSSILGS